MLNEVEVVSGMRKPLALFHGQEEQLVNGSYIDALDIPSLWRGAVQVIANAGHAPQWEQPEKFDALLKAFMEEVQR
jgi:pimeloyl-ACP methyl ester carboxylesterase